MTNQMPLSKCTPLSALYVSDFEMITRITLGPDRWKLIANWKCFI